MCWLFLCTVAPASAGSTDIREDGRWDNARAALNDSGVYIEPLPAVGEQALWQRRLEAALDDVRFSVPVKVALWTPIPDEDPEGFDTLSDKKLLTFLGQPDAVAVVNPLGYPELAADPGLTDSKQIEAVWARSRAVTRAIVKASPDPERYTSMTPAARAWVFLRLADATEPPQPRALVAELAGDPTLLVDDAAAPKVLGPGSDNDLANPIVLGVAAAVMLATVLVFGALTLRRRRIATASLPEVDVLRDRWAEGLTPLAVQQELTGLSEAIAASPAQPGQRDYDSALACADAAAQYVDSPAVADRVGVHLLVADGLAALKGTEPEPRCFFHPQHTANASVRRGKVKIPCCRSCARAVATGSAPTMLMVTNNEGKIGPYFENDDVWSSTGYGSIDQRWASRALLAALERR